MIRPFILSVTLLAAAPGLAQSLPGDDPVTKALLEQLRADQSGAMPPSIGGPDATAPMTGETLSRSLNERLATLEPQGVKLADMTCEDANCDMTLQFGDTDPAAFAERLHMIDTMLADAGPCEYGIRASPLTDEDMQVSAAVYCTP